MVFYKTFNNGLKMVICKMEGLASVSAGVMVKTGSINENDQDNGISHFIEHVLFKGTEKRSAFDISDQIDSVGAQINAFTSKEMTCYYTKSTTERLDVCLDVLADIFFNSVFDEKEIDRERGVVLEEINMSEDTPEDVCADLLAKSYYGGQGLGRTILGSAENIKKFSREDIQKYLDKYYTADNTVISIAGNVDIDKTVEMVEKFFAEKFIRKTSQPQIITEFHAPENLFRYKDIEQSHIAMAMPAVRFVDEDSDALNIANIIFGGGMSSRLFQTIREKLGLAYSVYSYISQYKNVGTLEIYAGVNTPSRDKAFEAILEEISKFSTGEIAEKEFLRGKEQFKSAFVFGKEGTASQMMVYGRYLLYMNLEFDFDRRITQIDSVNLDAVKRVASKYFNAEKMATATVGTNKSALR